MDDSTRGRGSMIRGMARGSRGTRMAIPTRASLQMARPMAREFIDGPMARSMMASGTGD